MNSKYAGDFNEIDFEAPITVKNDGASNYEYFIESFNNSSFKAKARAITDFDGDGILNVWEIDEKRVRFR